MASTSLWIAFVAGLVVLLIADLVSFGGKPREISMRAAVGWSVLWISISLAFCAGIWWHFGRTPAIGFLSGYLIEKSLSVDNLFIFVLIFHYFAIVPAHQHRVLVWGILGALTLRGALIAAGAVFISAFSWAFYVFGGFLVFAALHMLLRKKRPEKMEGNRELRWLAGVLPVSSENPEGEFFTKQNARWRATPLFLALLAIEAADLFFAVDSIPAVFGVTRDPFIVFSSNACAVLGLRALYFVLVGSITRLRHLATGVSVVLLFIGAKMITAHWLTISSGISLAVIAFVLTLAIAASLFDKSGRPRDSVNLSQTPTSELVAHLESADSVRDTAARELFRRGFEAAENAVATWRADTEIGPFITRGVTVGIGVTPSRFAKIRAALGNPPLADVPPDQDAQEFEWALDGNAHLDILTIRNPGDQGVIAKFLVKFGEGIQQVEFITRNIDRVTALLQSRIGVKPIYPATRAGANGTRVNFFLAASASGPKILVELVELKR